MSPTTETIDELCNKYIEICQNEFPSPEPKNRIKRFFWDLRACVTYPFIDPFKTHEKYNLAVSLLKDLNIRQEDITEFSRHLGNFPMSGMDADSFLAALVNKYEGEEIVLEPDIEIRVSWHYDPKKRVIVKGSCRIMNNSVPVYIDGKVIHYSGGGEVYIKDKCSGEFRKVYPNFRSNLMEGLIH
jgi:hypothetical protein